MPDFSVGSACLPPLGSLGAVSPAHSCTSRQSVYIASIASTSSIGLSAKVYTYVLSAEQLGQYISRDASNVVGSQHSIPICSASLRVSGSYSSAVQSRHSGMTTRSLGAASECLRVLYTQYPQPRPSTRRSMTPLPSAGIWSRSSVARLRSLTALDFRREPTSSPPTKPPMSFIASCCALLHPI